MLEGIMDSLGFIPDPIWVFLLAMLPFGELRISIPWGIFVADMDWLPVLLISIAGNMLPIPFILRFFKHVEKFLRRSTAFDRIFNWLFARTRGRAARHLEKYEELGLILFVAIPAPMTGAWTGALIAYLFGLEIKKSLGVIFLGVIIAGIIVTGVSLVGTIVLISVLTVLVGLAIAWSILCSLKNAGLILKPEA